MWLFAAFLAIPLIEIALFIQIGGAIGLGWTLVIVILTAIIGTWLVRNQGLMALAQVQSSFNRLSNPTEPIAHGAMILFSGALLLTPGFFTDAIGFALLVPGFRSFVFNKVKSRVKVHSFESPNPQHRHGHDAGDVIDGEFEEIRPHSKPSNTPSRWTED